MTLDQIYQKINSPEYDFLRTHPNLGDNVILLGLGGSHAYSTNTESSDLDVRGIATRSAHDILVGRDFEQVVNVPTDTTIYSFEKIIKLLSSCNPNVVELLGLKPEHYLHVSSAGELLLQNADLFLSKRALHSFGGYALAQLNRLCNKSGRAIDAIATNETRSLQKAVAALKRDGIVSNIVIDEVNGVPTLHIDDKLSIDSFTKLAQAVDNVHTDYRTSTRNNKAVEHNKLGKHQMHLVRLYLMACDILEKGEIITYREKEHDFLMDIRNGKYLTEDKQPTTEFMEMVKELESNLKHAAEHTDLPDKPDEEKIQQLVVEVNERIMEQHLGKDDIHWEFTELE